MKNFKSLIKQANKEVEKVVSYLQENQNAFKSTNLKLHDIAYNPTLQNKYNLSDSEYQEFFNEFCDIEYTWYKDERNYLRLTNKHNYIGSTSNFYLYDTDIIQLEINENIDLQNTIINMVLTLISGSSDIDYIVNENGLINIDLVAKYCIGLDNSYKNECIEDMKNDLEWISEKFLEYVKDEVEDIIKDYEYIQDFKNNQIEIFDNYIQDRIEVLF